LCSGYEFDEHVFAFGPNVRALTKPFEIEDLEALMNELCASVRDSAYGEATGSGRS
jgi:hypothetical protein